METKKLLIKKHNKLQPTTISLPASKSIANRALIIDALCETQSDIQNISEARDTQTMLRLLASEDDTWDVLDAGTTMRFLTAFAAATKDEKILTGTARMQERPIKVLVEALTKLGASITYLNNDGYPPIKVNKIKDQITDELEVPGNISSQYISALLMIAPTLPKGLKVNLIGEIGSKPYIDMTLAVMKSFGVSASWNGNSLIIAPQKYQPTEYTVEPDWSAASYWYSFVALSDEAEVMLTDLKDDSIQGDRKMADFMADLGVSTTFTKDGAILSKCAHKKEASIDFTHCPDLAQTVAVICAIKGIECHMTGLESLRIKETDRISALQNELAKFGGQLIETSSKWTLIPASELPEVNQPEFDTYHDHRMAMAFAPLSTQFDIVINDPSVVNKSYPSYWEDVKKAGFEISEL
ncbi:3-phosphoshikimate 1-carboxyvinyltransferase [Fulvivirga maritima]|uniref:3-phosphoshikimate 1-carboxyvinyltransferase n=1 Tax=Fulvivirga maritima TaxID=2904247 RepID=UPI001F2A6661|nr:3-phosphoshikimate 1-carboxyvinyltransferase [Fulvivirga maritima]UII29248.1 3-phosphoshikimate 1-carboxyvinyltransferase [Fulvivirga maritima]